MSNFTIKEFILLFLSILIICYANFVTRPFSFEPFYSLYPDVSESYPLHVLNDHSALKRDVFSVSFNKTKDSINSDYLITKIYSFFLLFFSLPMALKVISILLSIMTTILVYRISAKLFSSDFAFFPAGLFLTYFLSKDILYGGGARNFGIFLFCFFILCLENNKIFLLPILMVLSTLFYPYLFIPFTIVCIFLVLELYCKNANSKLFILWLLICINIGLFFMVGKGVGKIWGICIDNVHILGAYKYTLRVSAPINSNSPISTLIYFILNLNEDSKLHLYTTFFLLIASLPFVLINKGSSFRLSKSIWLMMIGCTISFFIIYPFQPVLASKEMNLVFPFFLVFFVSGNINKVIKNKSIFYLIMATFIITFLTLHPRYNSIRGYQKYKQVYHFIETLPKDALIAGNPKSELIRTIPFFANRAVFFSEKLSFTKLVFTDEENFTRLKSLIESLYDGSLNKIKNFVSRYGIDYFLIEDSYYKKPFFNYLESSINDSDKQFLSFIKNKKDKNNFILKQFLEYNYIFKANIDGDEVIILDAKGLNQLREAIDN